MNTNTGLVELSTTECEQVEGGTVVAAIAIAITVAVGLYNGWNFGSDVGVCRRPE